ncbi:MAG: hypothetical protein ACE5EF_00040 [Dehalococcoidia bacterium]
MDDATPASLDAQAIDQQIAERALEDSPDGLWFFLTRVLGYQDLDLDLHGELCDLLVDSGAHKFLLLLPRGHLKSSVVTIGYTMWRALQDPNRTFAIFNETEDLPLEFLREIREHFETNPTVRRIWGHLVPTTGNIVWRSDALQLNRKRISRTPTFAASSIGKSTAGRHPDVMILDDVVSDRTVRTPDGIKNTLSRFRELQALLEPPDPTRDHVRGTLIVIGTRWHWGDLYAHIIENLSDSYVVLKRSAIEDGKCIFPQKFNVDILRQKRDEMGQWVFSSQYLNEPVDSENAIFGEDVMRNAVWKGSIKDFRSKVPHATAMAIDPAWQGDDCWGICTAIVEASGIIRVVSAVRSKLNPDKAIDTVLHEVNRWKPSKIGIESVGAQAYLRDELKRRLDARGFTPALTSISHGSVKKEIRVLRLVPFMQQARLRIHESCADLLEELRQYPRGRWVDLIDSVEMLTRVAQRPGLVTVDDLRPRNGPGTGAWELRQLENRRRPKKGHPWRV